MPDRELTKAEFIASNVQAREIYLDGIDRGVRMGLEIAERLAAEEAERFHRAAAKSARAAVDTVAARNRGAV